MFEQYQARCRERYDYQKPLCRMYRLQSAKQPRGVSQPVLIDIREVVPETKLEHECVAQRRARRPRHRVSVSDAGMGGSSQEHRERQVDTMGQPRPTILQKNINR